MEQPIKRLHVIMKAVYNNYYNDLGKTNIEDDSTLDIIKINVIPHEGFHKNIPYIITLKFQEYNKFPFIYIDSILYDKIKTTQYLQNKGKIGDHKGICIRKLYYYANFIKNFKDLCDNKWENYVYYLITIFNNLQDFKSGNGIKSSHMEILEL